MISSHSYKGGLGLEEKLMVSLEKGFLHYKDFLQMFKEVHSLWTWPEVSKLLKLKKKKKEDGLYPYLSIYHISM